MAWGFGFGWLGDGAVLGLPHRAAPTGAPITGAPAVRVTATDLRFEPTEIRLPSGTAVNLTLANTGRLPHDLTVPKLGIQVVATAGAVGRQLLELRDMLLARI